MILATPILVTSMGQLGKLVTPEIAIAERPLAKRRKHARQPIKDQNAFTRCLVSTEIFHK